MLIKAAKEAGTNVLEAIDYLDDGTPICLKVTIDSEKGDAVFDFEGTGAEVRGNLNAPIAVVHSAIIYWYVGFLGSCFWLTPSMRTMVNQDIPLNAGCLVPLNSKYQVHQDKKLQLMIKSIFPKTVSSTHLQKLQSVLETSSHLSESPMSS
jgi:N-methylhydantoinase B/oxoprolinase/acetone carboxylase alpha subunit